MITCPVLNCSYTLSIPSNMKKHIRRPNTHPTQHLAEEQIEAYRKEAATLFEAGRKAKKAEWRSQNATAQQNS